MSLEARTNPWGRQRGKTPPIITGFRRQGQDSKEQESGVRAEKSLLALVPALLPILPALRSRTLNPVLLKQEWRRAVSERHGFGNRRSLTRIPTGRG
jgi:hypothetical protein